MTETLGERPWTTPEQVESRWIGAEELPADTATVLELIGDVEEQILAEFPDLAQRVKDGQITLRRITMTTALIIHRHLRNPNGMRSVAETKGPYSTTNTFGGDEPGVITLTDDDRRRLLGKRAGQKAFTVTPGPTVVKLDPLEGVVVNGSNPPGSL